MALALEAGEREAVREVRALLEKGGDLEKEGAAEFCSDATLLRFLRARKHQVELAHKMVRASIKWRADNRPLEVQCEACAQNPRSHTLREVGMDRELRPVFYSSFAGQQNKDADDNIDHIIMVLERTFDLIPAQQLVWIIDVAGFSAGDLTPSTGKQALKLFGDHYPERLASVIVLDSPLVFSGLWRVLKQWIDPQTHKKIQFVRMRDREAVFKAMFDDALFARIEAELADTRDEARLASKSWWEETPLPPPRLEGRKIVPDDELEVDDCAVPVAS
uniref:CRAL-TRIO domain-containing protein n=1 Tax=Erythrolobus australicus TaxID=1077150 RepID=A0A7S1TLG4_9RHOD|mmetsp:Transcript_3644/g.10142  ORF Transcript_3644/g.10142 Transcript_3644/m.10142 type:complete len:276 (+) Transcript_3644:30-857(+)